MTAELAAQAAQKLTSSNQAVAPSAPVSQQAQKKHHHKSHSQKQTEKDDDQPEGSTGSKDDDKAALEEARANLKKLHKINKMEGSFLGAKSTTMMKSGSHSHSHEGTQQDSPMLGVRGEGEEPKTVE
jgi:hypothetical protein